MPRAYSADMRARVIARVESGASRREAAEHYEVSASTAVTWVKCFRQFPKAADYVSRVLKGAKAGELFIQAPTRYTMVINLKTAKMLKLQVPATLLALADQVIE